MTRKIGIIGAGQVGSSVAMSLALNDFCNEIIMVDSDFDKVEAQALDIIDAMPYACSYTRILATDDLSALADVDILINCVGPEKEHDNPLDQLTETVNIVKEVFPLIMENGFKGIILNITNPCDIITMLIQQITGLPTNKVFGTGTSLSTARLYAHLGLTLQIDPTRVSGYVLGEYRAAQFIAWSTVRIDSFLIEKIISEMPPGLGVNFEAVEEVVKNADAKIIHGKGYMNFAIAQIATRIVCSIYNNTQTILPLSVYNKEFDTYLSIPTMVWKHGIRYNMPFVLTDEEQVKLTNAAQSIKANFAQIK